MGFPLRDRGYGPGPLAGMMTPGVKWLLVVNVSLFVLLFLSVRFTGSLWYAPFALVPRSVIEGLALWQLVTYLFIHSPGGFGHILMNMLTLWMFGTTLESAWGTRRFLQFYFFCGVGAGVCVVIANALFGSLDTRTIGASGAIFGLLLAFGVLFPDATIFFSFLFPIKARYYVLIMGAILFLSTIADTGGTVSHVAHLGGMLFGWIWLKSRLGSTEYRPGRKRWTLLRDLDERYRNWKLQRAKRKFQVYMKKHQGRDDRWVN
jgi:membrane associated rhomboid family serine protease